MNNNNINSQLIIYNMEIFIEIFNYLSLENNSVAPEYIG